MFGEGTSGALGWKSDENQNIRFEILSQIGDMSGLSVLDLGCGHGDLCGYLGRKYSDIVQYQAPLFISGIAGLPIYQIWIMFWHPVY